MVNFKDIPLFSDLYNADSSVPDELPKINKEENKNVGAMLVNIEKKTIYVQQNKKGVLLFSELAHELGHLVDANIPNFDEILPPLEEMLHLKLDFSDDEMQQIEEEFLSSAPSLELSEMITRKIFALLIPEYRFEYKIELIDEEEMDTRFRNSKFSQREGESSVIDFHNKSFKRAEVVSTFFEIASMIIFENSLIHNFNLDQTDILHVDDYFSKNRAYARVRKLVLSMIERKKIPTNSGVL